MRDKFILNSLNYYYVGSNVEFRPALHVREEIQTRYAKPQVQDLYILVFDRTHICLYENPILGVSYNQTELELSDWQFLVLMFSSLKSVHYKIN